jgi:hypothetical protein
MFARNMRRKIISVALTLACAMGLTVGFATPASASYTDCAPGTFCTFWYVNAGTPFQTIVSSTHPVGRCYDLPSAAYGDNQWSSFFNDYGNGIDVLVYKAHNCSTSQGLRYFLNGDYGNINSYLDASWDNSISSYMLMY